MAYSTPLTAVSNATLTAAQWNASVRDNILETAVAKATAAGRYTVSTAANTLAERVPTAGTVNVSDTTTATSYGDLPAGTLGPSVTVTSGTAVLVGVSAKIQNSLNTASSFASYAVSGATTVAASDTWGVSIQAPTAASTTVNASRVTLHTGLTAGSNTFAMKYRVSGGTGSFDMRHIFAIPF
jgi:hypothetical protein